MDRQGCVRSKNWPVREETSASPPLPEPLPARLRPKCISCGMQKDASEFPTSDSRGSGSVRRCSECRNTVLGTSKRRKTSHSGSSAACSTTPGSRGSTTEGTEHSDPESLKRCSLCGRDVGRSDYNQSVHTVDGLRECCKQCDREYEEARKDEKGPDNLYIMRYTWAGSPLKVGRARDVEARARQLESGHCFRLQVLAVFPGQGHLEREVHECLRFYRVENGRGREWFKVAPSFAFRTVGSIMSLHDPLAGST